MEVRNIGDDYAELEEGGLRVQVRLVDRSADGERLALLTLEPVNCKLEGEEPGLYYLVPDGS